MNFLELILIAVGLSMDAFAVSICKGLSAEKVSPLNMTACGAWFGGFQGLMPLVGYFVGSMFGEYIRAIDHWVVFILLSLIGFNMIKEAYSPEQRENKEDCFKAGNLSIMAIATSIDALAVGITFALLPSVNIWLAVGLITLVTFCFSAVGVKLGSIFGAKYKSKAELAGGIILVFMGLKILLEHLGVF